MKRDFRRPQVMAIVNVTPDSFYAGSRKEDSASLHARIEQVVREGASMVDVGGYSSRPGAAEVPLEEEWRRVERGISAVREVAPEMTVSVDTFRAEVAQRAVEKFGEVIVNDISAGELDAAMIPAVADMGVPYIAMHMKGTPQTMQQQTDYDCGIVTSVTEYFRDKTAQLLTAGICRENLILDPGFGFAKTLEQNYELLAGLNRLVGEGFPVLAGLSRKSMIYKYLGSTPEAALAGTIALDWECLMKGATILRVHDVREAVDSVRLFELYKKQQKA